MFLDDELLIIARTADLTENGVKYAIKLMVKTAFDNLEKNITETSDTQTILASFKRVNATWKRVVQIMENEGIAFVKKDGFELLVRNNPTFEGLLPK